MTDTIRLKRSLEPGKIPSASQLVDGELAINIADKKLYTISGSTVVSLTDVPKDDIVLIAGDSTITITGSVLDNVFDETTTVLPTFSSTDFSGAAIDYNAQRPGAARFGTVMASWSGSQVIYTDNSTNDIGETWDLSFTMIQVGNEVRLRAYSLGSGSGGWNIGFTITLFPNLL